MPQPPTQVVELAANLDDVTGEVAGDAVEALLADGALDVWTTPIGMKKNRPGIMLCLLCAEDDRDRLVRRMIELTGTFGVRWRPWQRLVLQRDHEQVETRFGPLRLKVGRLDGQVMVAKPEFEDVRQAAASHGTTVRQVMEAARAAADQFLARQGGRS